jgi:hypothetical protein
LIFLQTLKFSQHLSRDDQRCIQNQCNNYLIIDKTLYHKGLDNILHHCLNQEEAESVINDYHSEALGGHLFGLAKTQKILQDGYFWSYIFKYFIKVVKECHHCHVFTWKMRLHPSPICPVSTIGPFTKWGVNFMDCNPTSVGGDQYIIMVIEYFTKSEEAMTTIKYDGNTTTFFMFNKIIACFRILRETVTDHGSHFQNENDERVRIKTGV